MVAILGLVPATAVAIGLLLVVVAVVAEVGLSGLFRLDDVVAVITGVVVGVVVFELLAAGVPGVAHFFTGAVALAVGVSLPPPPPAAAAAFAAAASLFRLDIHIIII